MKMSAEWSMARLMALPDAISVNCIAPDASDTLTEKNRLTDQQKIEFKHKLCTSVCWWL
jgi:hypothetical protein